MNKKQAIKILKNVLNDETNGLSEQVEQAIRAVIYENEGAHEPSEPYIDQTIRRLDALEQERPEFPEKFYIPNISAPELAMTNDFLARIKIDEILDYLKSKT